MTLSIGVSMQHHALGAVLQDAGVMSELRGVLDPALFSDDAVSDVISWTIQQWDEHQEVPSKAAVLDSFKGGAHKEHRKAIRRAFREEITDAKLTIKSVRSYARDRKFRNTLLRGVEIYESIAKGTPEKDDRGKPYTVAAIRRMFEEAELFGKSDSDLGEFVDLNLVDKHAEAILHPETKEQFTTGSTHLDELGLMLQRGEVGCVLGAAKSGKSHMLLAMAVAMAAQGKTVFYYNCEIPKDRMRNRFFRKLAGKGVDFKDTPPEQILEKLRKNVPRRIKGKILIKKYAAKAVTPDDIRAHLREAIAKGHKPDVIIVDYLGLVAPREHNKEHRFNLESVWLDFRAICHEFNVAGWSAAQANREGAQVELVTMAQIGECFSIAQHIDAGVSISMTPEEKESQTGRLFVFVSRNERDGVVINFEHDYSRSIVRTTGIAELKDTKKKPSSADAMEEDSFERARAARVKKDRRDARP